MLYAEFYQLSDSAIIDLARTLFYYCPKSPSVVGGKAKPGPFPKLHLEPFQISSNIRYLAEFCG